MNTKLLEKCTTFVLISAVLTYHPKIFALSLRSFVDTHQFNMHEGVTPISHWIYDLHMLIFYICVGIATLVFVAMGYIFCKHRKSKGAKPAKFHDNLALEITWTLIPTLILVAMAVPATQVLIKMHDMKKTDVNIKITGMQWRWKYEYLDEGISFLSNLSTPQRQLDGYEPKGKWYLHEVDHPLVLPIHKKIRFLVTSSDVNHAWWVPDFGVKRDAIPGLITTAWAKIERPGVYRGACTEICGMRHGFMPVVVYAVNDANYKKFLDHQKHHTPLSQVELQNMVQDAQSGGMNQMSSGMGRPYSMKPSKSSSETPATNMMKTMSSTDQAGSPQLDHAPPPTSSMTQTTVSTDQTQSAQPNDLKTETIKKTSQVSPALLAAGKAIYTQHCVACHKAGGQGMPPIFKALKGSAIVTGPQGPNIHILLNGVQGAAMQSFRNILTPSEIASVITYTRNAWGNNDQSKYGPHAGGIVTTQAVKDHDKTSKESN